MIVINKTLLQKVVTEYMKARDGRLLYPRALDTLIQNQRGGCLVECLVEAVSDLNQDYICGITEFIMLLLFNQSREDVHFLCTLLAQNVIPLPLVCKSAGTDFTTPTLQRDVYSFFMGMVTYPIILSFEPCPDQSYDGDSLPYLAFGLDTILSNETGSILASPAINAIVMALQDGLKYRGSLVEVRGWSEAEDFITTIAKLMSLAIDVIIQYKSAPENRAWLQNVEAALQKRRPEARTLFLHRDTINKDEELAAIVSKQLRAEYVPVAPFLQGKKKIPEKKKKDYINKLLEPYQEGKQTIHYCSPFLSVPEASPQHRWLLSVLPTIAKSSIETLHPISYRQMKRQYVLKMIRGFYYYSLKNLQANGKKIPINRAELETEKNKLERELRKASLTPIMLEFMRLYTNATATDLWQCNELLFSLFKQRQLDYFREQTTWDSALQDNGKQIQVLEKKAQRKEIKAEEGLRQEGQLSPAEERKLAQLKVEKEQLEMRIANKTDYLTGIRITAFSFIEEAMEAYEQASIQQIPEQKELIESFLDCYALKMVMRGFPIHLIRGETLCFNNRFLNMVIGKCQEEIKKDLKRLSVVTVLGMMSLGKSTLLNALFGSTFFVNSYRCTIGLFCSIYNANNGHYILVLDSEGIAGSSRDQIFDKHLAALSLVMSDMIIYNQNGNLMRKFDTELWQMGFLAYKTYWKEQEDSSKPIMLFALRDADPSQCNNITLTVTDIKKDIEAALSEVNIKLEDCITFQEDGTFMFPHPFIYSVDSEKKMKQWNPGFSQIVSKCRAYILETLEKKENPRTNLIDFYQQSLGAFLKVTETSTEIVKLQTIREQEMTRKARAIAAAVMKACPFTTQATELVTKFDTQMATMNQAQQSALAQTTKEAIANSCNINRDLVWETFRKESTKQNIEEFICRMGLNHLGEQLGKLCDFYKQLVDTYSARSEAQTKLRSFRQGLIETVASMKKKRGGLGNCQGGSGIGEEEATGRARDRSMAADHHV